MKLYHGSNVEVRTPRILEPSHSLDFGPGFYTTLNRDQAVDFAGKVVLRRGGVPVVNEYEIDEKMAFDLCDTLKFASPDEVWLDFSVLVVMGSMPLKGVILCLVQLQTMMFIGR